MPGSEESRSWLGGDVYGNETVQGLEAAFAGNPIKLKKNSMKAVNQL